MGGDSTVDPAANSSVIPTEVSAAYAALEDGYEIGSGGTGLLHQTHHLYAAGGEGFVLQRVSEVFSVAIHDNIDAVARHLAARGVETFRLERTRADALYTVDRDGGVWRLMTRLPGVSFDRVQSVAQVESAGELVGRFHSALNDFDGPLAPMGIPFRDTAGYWARLESALHQHPTHPASLAVRALRDRIEAASLGLGLPEVTRERVIHGDLKISNVLFEAEQPPGADCARALIDFDTLLRAPLWSEWGDAWRSWCNRRGEDESVASFDLEIFEASIRGFAAGYEGQIDKKERDSLVEATERIALQLATRYATDALNESYFAWDTTRFSSASEHNVLRCEGQLSLFAAAQATRAQRQEILASVFALS